MSFIHSQMVLRNYLRYVLADCIVIRLIIPHFCSHYQRTSASVEVCSLLGSYGLTVTNSIILWGNLCGDGRVRKLAVIKETNEQNVVEEINLYSRKVVFVLIDLSQYQYSVICNELCNTLQEKLDKEMLLLYKQKKSSLRFSCILNQKNPPLVSYYFVN